MIIIVITKPDSTQYIKSFNIKSYSSKEKVFNACLNEVLTKRIEFGYIVREHELHHFGVSLEEYQNLTK